MEIKRYNIPKLPRSKYNTVGSYSNKYSGNIINNCKADLYDGLDSTSVEKGLTANLGKVLNDKMESDFLKKSDAKETYLSKTVDDTANGKITFKNGLITDSIVSKNIDANNRNGFGIVVGGYNKSRLFINDIESWYTITTPNVFFDNSISSKNSVLDEKGFIATKNDDSTVNMQVDNLDILGNLNVKNLEVEESKYIGGSLYCTLAGMVVSKVEVFDNYYKLYFVNEKDGVIIHNLFQVNDLAFCQTFNNNRARKYWCKVLAVGENFINISRNECLSNSATPEVGDNVVQLGNLRDSKRQGAVVISPNNMSVYNGINTYLLPDPTIILSPKGTKIDAETINFLGQTLINNNFIVDESGNLSINGKITTNSGKIGNFTINDRGLYNDASQGIAEIEITDSGEVNEVGFTLGKQGTPYLCDIYHRENGALRCTSEIGTAINAYSRGGFGLVASKTSVEGLHISPMVIGTNDNNVTLSAFSDFVIFNSNQALTVHFPNPKDAKGKIFILKNIGKPVTLYGSVVPKLEVAPNTQYDLKTASPIKFICDGYKWYEI